MILYFLSLHFFLNANLTAAWKAHVAALSGIGLSCGPAGEIAYVKSDAFSGLQILQWLLESSGIGGGGVVMWVCVCVWESTSVYLPATTTGLILTNCSRHVSADTPPPAYMPPDEQMGQESQSMDTSNNLVPPNMARGGESCTLPPSPCQVEEGSDFSIESYLLKGQCLTCILIYIYTGKSLPYCTQMHELK